MIENKVESEIKQYIVVKIENEQYGISIKHVDNIVRLQKITRVPKAQHYFKGVINLRGEIIPVMSLRLKMGLLEDVFTNNSRIIILKFDQSLVGIIVDQVKEIVALEESDVERLYTDVKSDKVSYVRGVGKHMNELISLLDIREVISDKSSRGIQNK